MFSIEYGIKTEGKDVQDIIKVINDILEEEITKAPDNVYRSNKIEKQKAMGGIYSLETEVMDSDLFDFTYMYHNKYWALTMELYPNKCKRGLIFPEDGVVWILYLCHCDNELILCNSNEPSLSRTNRLINKIIESLPFEGVLLHEYHQYSEDRILGNMV